MGRVVESDWLVIEADVWSRWGFPELRVAYLAAVVGVAGPELVRPVRVVGGWLVVLAALGAIVLDAALPSSALGALALGLAAAALVRVVLGTTAGIPGTQDVRRAMASLGVEVDDLQPAARQRRGAAEYLGHDVSGEPLKARVLGRDAQDTQRLARRWRALAYRDPPMSVAIGRLAQVEHEALATVMAAQAGARVPEVVTAALGPDGDALIVTRQPDVEPFETTVPERVADETLSRLWANVAALHAAGISHGRLNASNVILDGGTPILLDFAAATIGAPQASLDIDVAELLAATALLVGPKRATRSAVDGIGVNAVGSALPYLQRAAFTPHLRDLLRHHESTLKDLRLAAAAATGRDEPPEIAPMRRIRPRDLLLTALVVFAAYLLITQLAEIGFGTIAREVGKADPAWVVIAVSVVLVLAVPEVRAKVLPGVRSGLGGLWTVARIRRNDSSSSAGTSARSCCPRSHSARSVSPTASTSTSRSSYSSTREHPSSPASSPSPAASALQRQASPPASSRWASTSPQPSPSPSPHASAPSTSHPSGDTHRCAGSAGRATSKEQIVYEVAQRRAVAANVRREQVAREALCFGEDSSDEVVEDILAGDVLADELLQARRPPFGAPRVRDLCCTGRAAIRDVQRRRDEPGHELPVVGRGGPEVGLQLRANLQAGDRPLRSGRRDRARGGWPARRRGGPVGAHERAPGGRGDIGDDRRLQLTGLLPVVPLLGQRRQEPRPEQEAHDRNDDRRRDERPAKRPRALRDALCPCRGRGCLHHCAFLPLRHPTPVLQHRTSSRRALFLTSQLGRRPGVAAR